MYISIINFISLYYICIHSLMSVNVLDTLCRVLIDLQIFKKFNFFVFTIYFLHNLEFAAL